MTKPVSTSNDHQSATADEIRHLVGSVDDALIAAILKLRPSYREVELAVFHASGEVEAGATAVKELGSVALAVYDLLMADPAYALEPDR